MRERDPLQVGERLARADPRERAPVVARELPPQLVHEARLVGLERRQREAEDQVGDVVGAVLREREQEQAERPPRVVVEPAEQPEVEQAEPAVGREQDVSPVRIGVVDAVHGDLLHVGAEELPRQLLRPLAVDAVLRRHLLARIRSWTSTRSVTYGWITSGTIRCSCSATSLAISSEPCASSTKSSSAGEMGLELLGERLHLDEPGGLGVPLGEGGQRAKQLEVERDLLLDSRPPHLDDDLAAGAQQRAVDLRDRGARERLLVEPGERVEADVLVDDPASLRERERRHVVDELAQLVDVDVGQEVRTRGEQLAELHVRGAELLEAEPERLGALAASRACSRPRRPRRARAAACRDARHGRPRARA